MQNSRPDPNEYTNTVVVLSSHPNAPFFDHMILSPTYGFQIQFNALRLREDLWRKPMKYFFVMIWSVFLIGIQGYLMANCNDQLVYSSMINAIKPSEKKYNMERCGIGGAYDKGFHSLDLTLNRYGKKLTKEEARRIIIDCVDSFIDILNHDEKIRSELRDSPISVKNVSLIIINYETNKSDVFHPYINGISFINGKIIYYTRDPKNKYKFISEERESYEEALAILRAETNK